jgi:hypothetical protein
VTCWGDTSSGMWNSPSDTPSAIIWRLSFHSLRSWNSIEEKNTFIFLSNNAVLWRMGDFRFTHYVTRSWNSSLFAKFNFHFHFLFIKFFGDVIQFYGERRYRRSRNEECFALIWWYFLQYRSHSRKKMSCYAMFCMFFL